MEDRPLERFALPDSGKECATRVHDTVRIALERVRSSARAVKLIEMIGK